MGQLRDDPQTVRGGAEGNSSVENLDSPLHQEASYGSRKSSWALKLNLKKAHLKLWILLLVGVIAAMFVLPESLRLYPLFVPVTFLVLPPLWKRPALGIAGMLLLLAVPWRTGGEGESLAHLTLPDLVAAVVVGLVAVRTLAIGDQGRLRSWVLLPLTGVVLAGSVATITAYDPVTSLSGLIRYTELFVAVPVAVYLSLRERRDLRLILTSIVVLGAFEGIIGVYQFFTGTGASFGESDLRAVGTFGAYNIMGLSQVVSSAMIVTAAAFTNSRGAARWRFLVLLVALAFPLAFSLSRGAWIATVVGIMVVFTLSNWRKFALFMLPVVVAVGILTGLAEDNSNIIVDRLNSIYSIGSSPDQSVSDRYAMWQAARGMWADHPITGVGLKNFPNFRDLYAPLSFSGSSDIADPQGGFRQVALLSPHSLYWLILAEQGLIGALAYGALFLSLSIASLWRLRLLERHSIEKVLALSALGFLASYFISAVYGDVGGSTMLIDSVFFGALLWLASGIGLDEKPG